MAKKRFTEIEYCGYCGRIAAKEYPSPVIDRDYLWSSIKILPFGVCQECHDYFDNKYHDIDVARCEICGRKFRVKNSKKLIGWTKGFPIRARIYYETCHRFECLTAFKHEYELPLKLAVLRKEQKSFKEALCQLRKAIKGE